MLNKGKIITVVKNTIFIAGLILLVTLLSFTFRRKPTYTILGSFFQQADQCDVLFFGTSHIRYGIYPMELWEDYGITGYNLAVPGSKIARSYWEMENALDYANPKLVVFDVSSIWKNNKYQTVNPTHKNFDMFPLSLTKIRAIDDLFASDERVPEEMGMEDTKWEFLFDFLLYHNRWNDLTQEDFNPEFVPGNGGSFYVGTAKEAHFELRPKDFTTTDETISHVYLRKVIESCQARGIDILLTYVPSPMDDEMQRYVNSVYPIAEEYGVNFLNFMYVEGVVNYGADYKEMSKKGGHLNASGARRVTDYEGEYIMANYDLTDHRNDETYVKWEENYKEYTEYKFDVLTTCNTIDEYFSVLRDQHMDVYVYLKKGSEAYKNEKVRKMIGNLSYSYGDYLLKEKDKSGDYLLVIDNGAGVVREQRKLSEYCEVETQISTAILTKDEQGIVSFYLNGSGDNLFAGDWTSTSEAPDLQIVAVDHFSKEVVEVTNWKKVGSIFEEMVPEEDEKKTEKEDEKITEKKDDNITAEEEE